MPCCPGCLVSAPQGDAYLYRAATPHRVGLLSTGRRFTFVTALTERAPSADALAAAGLEIADRAERSAAYWAAATETYRMLTAGPLAGDFKVHILRGEHLEALGRAEEAREAYCDSYRATAEAAQSVQQFIERAVAAMQEQPQDLLLAKRYFEMAACVEPEHSEVAEALEVIHGAIAARAGQQHDEL